MLLVPAEILVLSTSPFADAARGLGQWGAALIAAGALVSTAGSINGNIFIAGQLPMAVALDRLAPSAFARLNGGGAPYISLISASTLSSVLLLMNYSRGLVGAFTFLILLSTIASLLPYLFSCMAELRHSWRSSRGWAGVALLAGLFAVFAIIGSGIEPLLWGIGLFASGLPLYFVLRRTDARPAQAL
jgi:APA family basic amino acid/polyamine antiporter